MQFRYWPAVALCCLLCVDRIASAQQTGPAAASTADPARAIDPQKLATAKEITNCIYIPDGISKGLLDTFARSFRQAMMFDNPNQEIQVARMLSDVVDNVFLVRGAEMTNNVASVYAATYSSDELQQIATFCRTSAGRKFARAQLDTVGEILRRNGPVIVAANQDVVKQLVEALKLNGMNVPRNMQAKVDQYP